MRALAGEASFQSAVISMAHLYGWRVAHFRPARTKDGWRTAVGTDGKGWPDTYLVHPENGWRAVAELKQYGKKLTSEQRQWLQWHERSGTPAFTWTPRDWEEIEQVLKNGPESR